MHVGRHPGAFVWERPCNPWWRCFCWWHVRWQPNWSADKYDNLILSVLKALKIYCCCGCWRSVTPLKCQTHLAFSAKIFKWSNQTTCIGIIFYTNDDLPKIVNINHSHYEDSLIDGKCTLIFPFFWGLFHAVCVCVFMFLLLLVS